MKQLDSLKELIYHLQSTVDAMNHQLGVKAELNSITVDITTAELKQIREEIQFVLDGHKIVEAKSTQVPQMISFAGVEVTLRITDGRPTA